MLENPFSPGGSSAAAPTTPGQPQPGTAQVYTPANQPGLDLSFQNVLTGLYNPALGELQAASANPPPAQVIYPQAQQAAAAVAQPGTVPGSFGVYGGQAVQGAQQAAANYQGLFGGLYDPLNAANQDLYAAQVQLPNLSYNAFNNPQLSQLTQNIINNPYFAQALQGAQTAAGYGQTAAASAAGGSNVVNQLAGKLPAAGEQAAATSTSQVPLVQGLAAQGGQLAPQLLQSVLGLNPQTAALYGATVPSLLQGAQQYSQAATQDNPLLSRLIGVGGNLIGAAQPLSAQTQQYQPLLNNLIAGGTIPAGSALAAQGAGLVPGLNAQLAATYAPLQAASNQILQTGFDPQNALYNRTVQRLTDQANAVNALSGVGTSPYGAGVTGNALSNFNIDWQNQQLGRQAQAAGVAGNLAGLLPGFESQAMGNIASAQNLLNQPAQQALQLQGAGLNATNAQANILNQLTQGGASVAQNAIAQRLAGTATGANILNQLTGTAAQTGQGLINQQLANTVGGGQLFNELAQGAGALAGQGANLATTGLSNLLSGYGGAANLYNQGLNLGQGATNLAASAAGLPAQTYNQQQALGLGALRNLLQQNVLGIQGLQGISGVTGQAEQQQLATQQGLAQAAGWPAAASTGQVQNALNALTQQLNLGNAQYQLPQQVLNDIESYLGLGQSASQISGQLGALGTQQQQNLLSNLGGLGAFGANALFGSPGLGLTGNSGLLGSGTSGLLGSGGLGGELNSSLFTGGNLGPSAFNTGLLGGGTALGDLSAAPIASYGGLSFADLADLGVIAAA